MLSQWSLRSRTRMAAAGVIAVAVVVVIVAAIVLVTRGGGATSPAAQHEQPASDVSQAPNSSAAASQPDSSASSVASATPPAGAVAGHGRTTPSPSPATWFTVSLGASCVVPGGRQTLTAQSRPGYTVAYNSHYADGKTGDAYGGYGLLATDAHGRVVATWTVSASAPLGQVTVGAGTGNGGAPTTATRTFVVAAHC